NLVPSGETYGPDALPPKPRTRAPAARLPAAPGVAERGGLRGGGGPCPRRRQSLAAEHTHRPAPGRSPRRRPVEPVPARLAARPRGPVQPRLRAAVRTDGTGALGARGVQLQRAR